ncbi:hotdog family protein [Streptacidiphilus fuscans]|uniref:Thioesterase family protein n=1 Tax=Streptacidiphilus fuscans TaxID=2789292 RepID=A0A931B8A9_9ACTN|nr:hypothetical protein [Streptacidiphilus fuscans]MBF9069668.1 hypothetical protein [Streptacidiphilus fuscans]
MSNPVELVVPSLFNGPPTSANGGWISGALAQHVGNADTVVVTLRQPPPLERPMTVVPVPDGPDAAPGGVRLLDGELLVGEAAPAQLAELGTPPPVPFDVAEAAQAGFRGHKHHPFPTCFACGTGRGDLEGLHLFAGPVTDEPGALHACTWIPRATLADPGAARVRPEFVWAALDCPGAWTVDLETRDVVLGRITARVDGTPAPGEACVITSRLISQDGRKFTTCTALYDSTGRLLGEAESVWIELRR